MEEHLRPRGREDQGSLEEGRKGPVAGAMSEEETEGENEEADREKSIHHNVLIGCAAFSFILKAM